MHVMLCYDRGHTKHTKFVNIAATYINFLPSRASLPLQAREMTLLLMDVIRVSAIACVLLASLLLLASLAFPAVPIATVATIVISSVAGNAAGFPTLAGHPCCY